MIHMPSTMDRDGLRRHIRRHLLPMLIQELGSQREVARRAGVSATTISHWMAKPYRRKGLSFGWDPRGEEGEFAFGCIYVETEAP